MKARWEKTTLGVAFTTVTGGTPAKSNEGFYGDFMPLVKPPELCDSELDSAEDGLSEAGAAVARTAPLHSILVSCIGNLGKVGLNTIPVAFNQQINAIFPDEDKALPSFMFYQTLSCSFKEQLESLASGTTVPIVNKSKFNSIEIVLPPLPEQQRIVAILDEAFEAIAAARANAAQNRQNAKALFESYLQSVFSQRGNGWVERSFSEVCEISSTLVDPRQEEYLEQIHIGGANIEAKTGKLLELRTAREENLISGKFIFDESMVLYSKIRPYLMKVVRPDFKGLCSADIYPLSPKSGVLDRNYLFHMLLSPQFTDYANAGSARAGMPKVNRGHLFSYRCFFPPIEQQIEFAASLDALHEETQCLESLYQRKIDALDELKQSLLQQAFSGYL